MLFEKFREECFLVVSGLAGNCVPLWSRQCLFGWVWPISYWCHGNVKLEIPKSTWGKLNAVDGKFLQFKNLKFGERFNLQQRENSSTVDLFLCGFCFCVPAEVASLLIRNVSYEGPALKKQLAKAQQLQQELSRREVECQSSAAELRERYYAACRQYGISVSPREIANKFGSVFLSRQFLCCFSIDRVTV